MQSNRMIPDRLLENFQLNPGLADKILPNLFGLGGVEIETEVLAHESRSIATSVRGLSDGKATRIQIRDAGTVLSPIVERARAAQLEIFVKIDCEGSEFDIFDSLNRRGLFGAFRGVLVEWHKWWDATKTQRDLVSRLLANGYVVLDRTKMADPWAGRFNAIRVGDAVSGT